jgi:hypothetical protein
MWTAIKKSSVLALMFLGVCVGSARAEEVKVNVPFPFVVHGQTLPAGEYVVQPVDQDPAVIMIRGEHANHKWATIVLTNPADGRDPAGEKPALTFTRVETQYRLSTIWESGTEGRTLSKS